jgi:hypothetical protein
MLQGGATGIEEEQDEEFNSGLETKVCDMTAFLVIDSVGGA